MQEQKGVNKARKKALTTSSLEFGSKDVDMNPLYVTSQLFSLHKNSAISKSHFR